MRQQGVMAVDGLGSQEATIPLPASRCGSVVSRVDRERAARRCHRPRRTTPPGGPDSRSGGETSYGPTANPSGAEPPLMKLWFTPVPSRLARPIVPLPGLLQ